MFILFLTVQYSKVFIYVSMNVIPVLSCLSLYSIGVTIEQPDTKWSIDSVFYLNYLLTGFDLFIIMFAW